MHYPQNSHHPSPASPHASDSPRPPSDYHLPSRRAASRRAASRPARPLAVSTREAVSTHAQHEPHPLWHPHPYGTQIQGAARGCCWRTHYYYIKGLLGDSNNNSNSIILQRAARGVQEGSRGWVAPKSQKGTQGAIADRLFILCCLSCAQIVVDPFGSIRACVVVLRSPPPPHLVHRLLLITIIHAPAVAGERFQIHRRRQRILMLVCVMLQ